MNASPKNARQYHLAIRCGEVVKEVRQKNHPPLRTEELAGDNICPAPVVNPTTNIVR
jgi:hypothetical protein